MGERYSLEREREREREVDRHTKPAIRKEFFEQIIKLF